MADRKFGIETLALHAGQIPDPATGSRAVPLYQTTSYVFDSADHAASLFNLQTFGNVYTRISNPTTAVLEERVAALEGGRAAVATATTFVDPDDPENFRRAIKKNTKILYAETLGNPLINIVDVEAIAKIAREAGVPFIVDNTVPSPYLCRPFEWGADIVVHSATKYIGGHGTTMGGLIVESGKFPWDNGKFPGMTEPSRGYHGVRFYETFGDFGYTMRARMETLRTFGPALSPFNSWLLLQGLETLPVRMERHCTNTLAVAKFLQDHSKVSWVNYPGLPDNKYHKLAQKYLPKGASGLLNFGVKGGAKAGEKFIEAATFMSHLANIGDAKTLIIHPASTTHRQMSEDEQAKAGVTPDMIRISVGLETLDDILWDIDNALSAAAGA